MRLIPSPENGSDENLRQAIEDHLKIKPYTEIVANGHKLIWSLPNENAWWRARNLLTVEVETIAWLDAFDPDDILLDVGANMGLYSLYAGRAGHRVFSFEPESNNFALLNTNIYANKLSEKITAWCAALSNKDGLDRLYLSWFWEAGSNHSFGANVDDKLNPRKSAHVQGAIGVRLDTLIEQQSVPVPNHIKIDVDGFEHKVIEGGLGTLKNPQLKSVLVEMNRQLPAHCEIFRIMADNGFHCPESFIKLAEYRGGYFDQVGNILFARSLEWAEEIVRVGAARFASDPVARQLKNQFESDQGTPTGAFPDETLHLSMPKPSFFVLESVEKQGDNLVVIGRCDHPEFAHELRSRLKSDGQFSRDVSEPELEKAGDRVDGQYRFRILCQ